MKSVLVVLVLTLMTACSSGGDAPGAGPSRSPQAAQPGSASACSEVRAGIDAFNQGDFDETVVHFRKAVPLARAEAETKDSTEADLLVKAVTYYADLAPGDYPASSQSSPDFARYKQITLGQCEGGGREPSAESPGVPT